MKDLTKKKDTLKKGKKVGDHREEGRYSDESRQLRRGQNMEDITEYFKIFIPFFPFSFFLFFFFFLGPHQQHMEVPRLGVELEL